MRKAVPATLAILLLVPALQAQNSNINIQQRSSSARASREKKEPPTISKEERDQAIQLLESAEAGARGMDAGSRTYAFMQIARMYRDTDKKKAVELLDEAWSASRTVGQEDDRLKGIGRQLQQQVLKAMVPIAPEKADDLLLQLDARGREQVLNALLDYYEQQKMMDRAIEVIYRIGQENEIPYLAASRVMEKMTPEQSADKQQMFTTAMGSYSNHDHTEGGASFGGGFAEMIVEFQHDLPPSLIHQAIDVVLDSARKQAEKEAKDGNPTTISIASADGAVQLNSTYTYRLFQLLPVLKSIDPDEADRLLKQQNEVQSLMAKYPSGLSSVTGDPNSKNGNHSSFMVSSGTSRGSAGNSGGGRPAGADGPSLMEMQRAAKIEQDADTHPAEALTNTAALQDAGLRTNTYVGIARNNWKKNSSIAHQALQKASESLQQSDGDFQMNAYTEIARIYLHMGETDDAKKFVSKGLDAVDKLTKKDTNGDDPNRAPKAYWPSTAGYRSMLSLATEISAVWATNLLKEIPDEEMRSLGQLGIAMELLHSQPPTTEVMTFNKQGGKMMMSMNQDREE